MIKDGQIVCDNCQKVITRITEVPAGDKMHNLCSPCFDELRKTSIARG